MKLLAIICFKLHKDFKICSPENTLWQIFVDCSQVKLSHFDDKACSWEWSNKILLKIVNWDEEILLKSFYKNYCQKKLLARVKNLGDRVRFTLVHPLYLSIFDRGQYPRLVTSLFFGRNYLNRKYLKEKKFKIFV